MTDKSALFDFVVALADDALVLGHRLSEWSGHAPTLEQDIALSNLGLDLIGQARLFYTYAGEIEGAGRNEDDLAYFRDQGQYRNLLLLELPIGDFAQTMARQFLYSAFLEPYFAAMMRSTDVRLAEIASKAVKEMTYHVRHTAEWVIRLGDGTEESQKRLVSALDDLWCYTGEMFVETASERLLVTMGIAPDKAEIKSQWLTRVGRVLTEATVETPRDGRMQSGGRSGRHTEHLGHLLGEMQVLARSHPGAVW
ncbi:MAG: 1,2-phenylacetyl-CoA epoxidase subunit PaaC [Hyphomicrobiaceae bacterium]|nr:phenylacetate-CoA oxygenase subunit PaaC [Hyphomicrobiaceae bacterium]